MPLILNKNKKGAVMSNQNNKLDFTNQEFHIGIDVHKKNWSVTVRSNQMELKTFSMNPSPEDLQFT